MRRFVRFLKEETVLTIVAVAAICSIFVVPVSTAYLEYFNWSVIALLFSLMLVVAGFQKCGVFNWISAWLCLKTTTVRGMSLALVFLCFFSSMFVTNDVALLTFVPFAVLTLSMTGQQKRMPYVIVLQTVAANLGSMLTPVGNPQNLYLYSYYKMDPMHFFALTLPISAVSLFFLTVLCFLVPREEIREHQSRYLPEVNRDALLLYLGLFICCLGTVFRFYHWSVMLVLVTGVCLIQNRNLFREVDYGLLLTFLCFFIFTGNLGRIPVIQDMLYGLLQGKELWISALTSQIISNVPAAILLSGFTDNASALVLGTNIGGLGTLVASLASLISYKAYTKFPGADKRKYVLLFTGCNGLLLIVLLLTACGMLAF